MNQHNHASIATVTVEATPQTTVVELSPSKSGEDLFNLEKLRLSQDYQQALGAKKATITVPVKKPGPQDFVRVHSAPEYQIETYLIKLKEENEFYLVAAHLHAELQSEPTPYLLLTTINRQGVLFLWPIRMPGADGKLDDWNQSAIEAAKLARLKWVRVTANRSLGAYDVFVASGNLSEPEWPDADFGKLVRTAFRERVIDSLDHPVVKRLRGL